MTIKGLALKRSRACIAPFSSVVMCGRSSGPIPSLAILTRVLAAAHHAPSVGFMQPWDFIIIDDPAIRAAVKHMFTRENARAEELHGRAGGAVPLDEA